MLLLEVTVAMKLKVTCSLDKKLWPNQIPYYKVERLLKKKSEQSKLIFRCNVWRREQDHKNWVPKYRCFATVGMEKMFKSSVVSMEFKLVKHEGSQLWLLMEGLMLNMKSQYIGRLRPRAKSLERNWCWERLRAGGDGCKASLTQKSWVWENCGQFEGRGSLGFLLYMQSQRVKQDWVTEQHQKIGIGSAWEMVQIAW